MNNISFTNTYTSYVYYKHGISNSDTSGIFGKTLYWALYPVNLIFILFAGISLEKLMLERTVLLDQALWEILSQHNKCSVIEIGCGRQERSLRAIRKFPDIQYYDTDIERVTNLKNSITDKIKILACDITKKGDLTKVLSHKDNNEHEAPTIIISEGVLVYFSPNDLKYYFSGIEEFSKSNNVFIIFETYQINSKFTYYLIACYQYILSRLTQSNMNIITNHDKLTNKLNSYEKLRKLPFQGNGKNKNINIHINIFSNAELDSVPFHRNQM